MSVKQFLLMTLLIAAPLILFGTDYQIATSDLNIRSGPGAQYSVVLTVLKGEKVEVLSKTRNWYKIKYSEKIGYANSKYLSAETNTYQIQNKYLKPEFLIAIAAVILIWAFKRLLFEMKRKQRRDYYRNEYLNSDEWQRKRYVVHKRDNWQCVYCGAPATQVHHMRYAKKNIGNEPIQWLVSVCKPCHDAQHS